MKNFLLIFITIPLIIGSCTKGGEIVPTTQISISNNIKYFGGEGNDRGVSVKQTTDGGYLICGDTESFGNGRQDMYLIKTNSNCDLEWYKTFGGEGNDYCFSVTGDQSSVFTIVGGTYPTSEILLFSTQNSPNINNDDSRSYEGSIGNSVQRTTDGGYIITGFSSEGSFSSVCLIKTLPNRNELWNKTFDLSTGHDIGRSVQQTTDGGYIITGDNYFYGNSNIFLLKTDENGNELWTKTFEGLIGNSVQRTTDGGYIITGVLNHDVCLIKTDENGNELWTKTFGGEEGEESDVGKSVQQTTDGGYIIVGSTRSFGNGQSDVYLIKTDENGEELWSQTFGGESNDYGESVQETTDGEYIITGTIWDSESGFGKTDVLLIKTDRNGDVSP